MATIIANGCWDVFHEGHRNFLIHAKGLGGVPIVVINGYGRPKHHLIVAVNSDESARQLKSAKWGEKYPIDSLEVRMEHVAEYADEIVEFETEKELHELIEDNMPCILVKGPDYVGKSVTGDDIAPVLILDTPEPESVKQMKKKVYGQHPAYLWREFHMFERET